MFCSSCGWQNNDDARFCQGCGQQVGLVPRPSHQGSFPAKAEGSAPAKGIGWFKMTVLIVLPLFGGLFVIGVISRRAVESQSMTSEQASVDANAQQQKRMDAERERTNKCTTGDPNARLPAEMALYSWKNGSSSGQYWKGGIEAKRLFTVKSYEFLDQYYVEDKKSLDGRKPHSSAHKFRIQSSTQGGFPITKDWYIDVTLADGVCKIYEVEEAD